MCCSAWWWSGLWIGVLLCCWSFEGVNQVLVRLWACLVAAADRMVGLPRAGVGWVSCDRIVFRGVCNVLSDVACCVAGPLHRCP